MVVWLGFDASSWRAWTVVRVRGNSATEEVSAHRPAQPTRLAKASPWSSCRTARPFRTSGRWLFRTGKDRLLGDYWSAASNTLGYVGPVTLDQRPVPALLR